MKLVSLSHDEISKPGSFYWEYRHKFLNISESLICLQELYMVFLGLAFCGLKGISSIILEWNKLELPPDLTPVKPNLRKLFLMSNYIKWFPNNFFSGFNLLHFIDLADNKLAVVPNLNWPGVRESLLALNLKCNYIKIIDFLFAKDKSIHPPLRYLDLHGNRIAYFNVQIIEGMNSLTHISLHDNKLTTLDEPTLLRTTLNQSHFKISLGWNPWHCDNRVAWISSLNSGQLWSFLFREKITIPPPTCFTPGKLRGMNISCLGKSWRGIISEWYRTKSVLNHRQSNMCSKDSSEQHKTTPKLNINDLVGEQRASNAESVPMPVRSLGRLTHPFLNLCYKFALWHWHKSFNQW